MIFVSGNMGGSMNFDDRNSSLGKGLKNKEEGIGFTRVCKICGEDKKLQKFPYRVASCNGLLYYSHTCNVCQYKKWLIRNEHKRDRYVKNQRQREFFTIKGRATMLRNRCKTRARKHGLQFSLSKEIIIEKLKKGVCEQTKIPLVMVKDPCNPYSPSIDRIDNNKGYTDDNIQIVCTIYNFCKNQFTDLDVKQFIREAKI